MSVIRRLLMVTILAVLIGLAYGRAIGSGDSVNITSESEEGFHDLTFLVQDQSRESDGKFIIKAHGRHGTEAVGVVVVLGAVWKQVTLHPNLPKAFQGTVELRSVGKESDTLLRVMDQLYGTQMHPRRMRAGTTFTGITLEGDPR